MANLRVINVETGDVLYEALGYTGDEITDHLDLDVTDVYTLRIVASIKTKPSSAQPEFYIKDALLTPNKSEGEKQPKEKTPQKLLSLVEAGENYYVLENSWVYNNKDWRGAITFHATQYWDSFAEFSLGNKYKTLTFSVVPNKATFQKGSASLLIINNDTGDILWSIENSRGEEDQEDVTLDVSGIKTLRIATKYGKSYKDFGDKTTFYIKNAYLYE